MKKQGYPDNNELVVCKIRKIYPNSASAELIEYRRNGMIHVSEVASRWVKNIREFIKEGEYVICKVMRIDNDTIELSLKRVRQVEATSRLNEFKRERKAEKLLEIAAKQIGKTLDDAYKEVGYLLQEEIGSLSKSFEVAVKNPELLRSKGVSKEWMAQIEDVAKKNYSEKVYDISAELSLVSYNPKGIEIIKDALLKVSKDSELEVKYISTPKYLITGRSKNIKELSGKVEKAAEAVVNEVNKQGGECSFKIIEE